MPADSKALANKMIKTLSKKMAQQRRDRVSMAYNATCHGIEVPMMELTNIMKIGQMAIDEGVDDTELGNRIRAYVETIRAN